MASNQFSTTTHYVMPTRNDVAPSGYEGFGRVLQELTFAPLLNSLGGHWNFVADGFELPGAGAGITSKTITSGEAVIDGYRIATHSTAFSVDLYDDTTNYVYLRLLKTLSKVTEVVIEVHDSAPSSSPSSSVFLGTVLTASGSVSSSTDRRPMRFTGAGTYTGDGTASRTITIPGLGSNRANVFCIMQWADTWTTAHAFFRCFGDREVVLNWHESTGASISDFAAGTYLLAGGFNATTSAPVTNTNNIPYFYRLLA